MLTFAFMHYPYLVCMLFGMPSLHLFTFLSLVIILYVMIHWLSVIPAESCLKTATSIQHYRGWWRSPCLTSPSSDLVHSPVRPPYSPLTSTSMQQGWKTIPPEDYPHLPHPHSPPTSQSQCLTHSDVGSSAVHSELDVEAHAESTASVQEEALTNTTELDSRIKQ